MKRLRRLAHWVAQRDPRYIAIRLWSLLTRYGLTPGKAEKRILAGVESLSAHGAHPTFPTPGRVVDRNGRFCRQLQRMGAELAVHGYDHLDFRGLSHEEAMDQLSRASEAYRRNELEPIGFRFPYLSRTEGLLRAIPAGMFEYSSNRAIWWDAVSEEETGGATAVFDSLRGFYRAESAAEVASVPRIFDNLVEIPVSLPDDIQLFDGLRAGQKGVARAWSHILRQTHRRGELFALLFHPELFDRCELALDSILREASQLRPAVWVTRLRDVARWWCEKAGFAAQLDEDEGGTRIRFRCSERATVLARNVEIAEPAEPWHGPYRAVRSREVHLEAGVRPFLGVAREAAPDTVSFLREQGYIVEAGEEGKACSLFLDASTLADLRSQVRLIDYIESSEAPMLRFWRWPDRARSALSITGDLDALSLLDYTSRLAAR